jgi:quinol-cytochrome oxidoreductase complex cytochrome b subunit
MKLEDLKEHMDGRFDKLEDNQEGFFKATTQNATDITWLKGHVKWTVTILLAVTGFLAAAYLKQLGG